jgi:WbqC-like protein family
MQPYFMPYAGYFRLMAAADLFVFYDCVQFPRRGWVHRNKLTHKSGAAEWLTLPLAKGDRDSTRIMDLEWAEGAQGEWERRMAEFPALTGDSPLLTAAKTLSGSPNEYIMNGLRSVCEILGIKCDFAVSGALNLPDSLKAQDRILAIAEHYKATSYVNAPNGRELYDENTFRQRGITLSFLTDYQGKLSSILERLLTEPAGEIASEIQKNL